MSRQRKKPDMRTMDQATREAVLKAAKILYGTLDAVEPHLDQKKVDRDNDRMIAGARAKK